MENEEVVQLYLDDIIPNRFQPREVFNDQALKELAISIREHGVIQPILVRKFGDKYEIIAGERRYKASTMAGLTKIPAIVKNLDDKESSKVALIENLQRRDLTPIEEARTYQKILDLDEMTQEDLAKTMGKSQSAVSNKLRLLSLPDEVQEALLKEEISERHARSLLNLPDRNMQVELLKEVINNRMTVRELDNKIKALTGDQEVKSDTATQEVPNLFGSSTPTENSVMNNDVEVKNMNDNNNVNNPNNLFGDVLNPIAPPTQEMQPVADVSNNFVDNSNVENDPTMVDINKIREQSTDLSPNVPMPQEKSSADINDLLKPAGQKVEFGGQDSHFIPNFGENTNNQNRTIDKEPEELGDGLLAGMPIIKPVVEQPSNNDLSQNNNNLFGLPSNSLPEEKADTNNSVDNLNNDLFTTPTIDTINPNSNDSLSGSQNVSPLNNNDVNLAVADVKNVIKSYQDKGYRVSIEELNLDGEIQLNIKFSK